VTEGILWLFAAIVVFAVLRAVIGIVSKGVSDFFAAAAPPSSPSPPRGSVQPETLVKDPVCGTFLPETTPLRKTVNGKTYCFCSTECRDKFKG
jgi:YHS domain-containing protein